MSYGTAVIIGNTDGIGKELTMNLLASDIAVIGLSKSPSDFIHPLYTHYQVDVTTPRFREKLNEIFRVDLCVYCAGIGEELDLNNLAYETKTFQVNLMGAVVATEIILKLMLDQGHGHFIGLSSVADELISDVAPGYSASKAGISKYWEGLGLAIRKSHPNVHITNLRFGFVETKMAKSAMRPLMLSRNDAVEFIYDVVNSPRIRASKPKRILPLVFILRFIQEFKLFLHS